MLCLNWNVKWAKPASKADRHIRPIVKELDPDLICFTEVTLGLIPEHGHTITGGSDWGYSHKGDRRKVVLWSREPWSDMDQIGAESLPPGRFVSGVTAGIRFVGVCIPWRDAHVRTGQRDRESWQDHLAYLAGLKAILEGYRAGEHPVCVVGDYNQRIPRRTQPKKAAKALDDALGSGMEVATAGVTDGEGLQLIDHFAHTPDLQVNVEQMVSKRASDGTMVSDHVGVVGSILIAVS